MMKKIVFLIGLIAFNSWYYHAVSQNNQTDQRIDSINTILKENPYHDGFNDISFYYSISITPERELIVEMNFDGPFRWVYKANIDDLDLTPKNDACRESPSSLCWQCKQTEPGKQNSCIEAVMILTDGEPDKQNASNICVSFSGRGAICNDLNQRFQRLFDNYNRKNN